MAAPPPTTTLPSTEAAGERGLITIIFQQPPCWLTRLPSRSSAPSARANPTRWQVVVAIEPPQERPAKQRAHLKMGGVISSLLKLDGASSLCLLKIYRAAPAPAKPSFSFTGTNNSKPGCLCQIRLVSRRPNGPPTNPWCVLFSALGGSISAPHDPLVCRWQRTNKPLSVCQYGDTQA